MVRSSLSLLLVLVSLLWAVSGLTAAPLPVGPTNLDDPIEPLKPDHEPTQADRERLEAVSLFAAGRIEEQRENYTLALKLYQRALRHDPKSVPILRQIIEVARHLDRIPEAMRYAMLAVELDPSDPRLVWALADQMAEQGHNAEALALCRKARELMADESKSVVYVSLSLRVGQLAHDLGEHHEAADALAVVLDAIDKSDEYGLDKQQRRVLLSDEGRIFDLAADVFLADGRADAALDAFDRLDKLHPNKGLHAYHLAQVDVTRKQYDAALDHLQQYFDSHEIEGGLAPYELLAEVLGHLDREKDLIAQLDKIRQDDPGNVPLRYFLAGAYRKAGDLAKAEPHYRDLLKQSPASEAYEGLVDVYLQQKDAAKLLGVLGQVADKTHRLDAVDTAVAELVKDQDLVKALLDVARERRQADADTVKYGELLAAALVALEADQYDAAGEFFDAAIDVRADNAAETVLYWGQQLLGDDQYAPAIVVFRRGIDDKLLPEDNPIFHTYLAMALTLNKQIDEALDVARDAAEMGEGSAFLDSRVPWVLYYGKRYDEARQAYEKLIEEYDTDHGSEDLRNVLREARLALSNLYVIAENIPAAEEALQRVLDEFPDNAGAQNDLGYLWADQDKNLDRALEMIERAVAADPDSKAYRDSLGWVYYRLGRFNEAIAELKKATDGDTPDGVILDHLGDALKASGAIDEARDAWTRSRDKLTADGETDKAAAVQKKLDDPAAAVKEKKKPPPE